MDQTNENEIEINVGNLMHYLLKKLWLILLCGFLTAGFGYYSATYSVTPLYRSTATIQIIPYIDSVHGVSLSNAQLGSILAKDCTVIATSRAVLERTIEELDFSISYENLYQHVSVYNPKDTRIIKISVTYSTPELAKQITDKIATVFSEQISEIMGIQEPKIVDPGNLSSFPYNNHVSKYTLLGFLIGAGTILILLTIINILDDKIQDTKQIEQKLKLNIIGMIPYQRKSRKKL